MERSHSGTAGSFRDPAGFVFTRDGVIYRHVDPVYRHDYDRLLGSGLYDALASGGLLIPHSEVRWAHAQSGAYKILEPAPIKFLSYPYEWSFSQLKDAALTTLAIQDQALAHEMSLKDGSAYNIQFRDGRPILIDTLSFESYREGRPWTAYRQFCQQFLAPLALMSAVDVRLGQLARVHLDGTPLDLASRMLPVRTWLKFSLLSHVHLHALAERHFAGVSPRENQRRMSRTALRGLIDSLRGAVEGLTWRPLKTGWAEYDTRASYSADAMAHKAQLVRGFLEDVRPGVVWDLGSNTGRFSRLAAEAGCDTIAFDGDAGATERHYLACRSARETRILPLVVDLTNPSPAIGWANAERSGWSDRGPADAILALALVHHLAIGHNVPFARIAEFLRDLGTHLIVEFVPKEDVQVQRLLASREDVYSDYSQTGFERAFGRHFVIRSATPVRDSQRIIYVMRRR